MSIPYPFSALVGQDEMKRAILIAAVEPAIGGLLVLGDRGTGKSTAVRGLAALLPKMRAVHGCRYHCDPDTDAVCEDCARLKAAGRVKVDQWPVPVVDLPLGASEDRVLGALDLERALSQGVKVFEPGLLARDRVGCLAVEEPVLRRAAELCVAVGSDGLRGELTLMRAARAMAALEAATEVTLAHLRAVAVMALRHRLRRNPLDDTASGERIERAVAELWA